MKSVYVICEGLDFTALTGSANIVGLMDLAFHNGQVESFYMRRILAP